MLPPPLHSCSLGLDTPFSLLPKLVLLRDLCEELSVPMPLCLVLTPMTQQLNDRAVTVLEKLQ